MPNNDIHFFVPLSLASCLSLSAFTVSKMPSAERTGDEREGKRGIAHHTHHLCLPSIRDK